METGKPGLVSAPVHISSVAAQAEKRMDIQAPLTAVYIHTVPAVPAQPYPQPAAAAREPATLHLAMPPLYSKETLPFLTLHIAGGLQAQPGLSLAAAAPAARPKSAGKHVCPHCGRDCMKPSVLEKHLRCHTGERPYPCTTCGVSFKTQSNLYKHRRTQAHARLSSESEQSSLGSLDSMSSSRETCASSLSVDERSEELGGTEKDTTLPATESTSPASTTKVYSAQTQSSVSEKTELTLAGHRIEPNEGEKVTKEEEEQRTESEKPSLSVSRHLPLQRQEATLFSKQWESSVSRGKSQSHESTDSGFSEISDHYPSPGSVLPDHSMDSLTESTKEHLEEATSTHAPSETGHGGQEPKDVAREQKSLEERISKLISENTAVVEDKQLENVRPRKTVLSKQGSIDLPMPYTYKDSFHFDMKIGQTQNLCLQRNRKPGLYSSVPTQRSPTMDHAPLTRSNSLPFSVTLLPPERSSPTSSHQSDYVTLVRRGSSGQINPTGFAIKPVNQHSSTHRPLVRQTAVDCNHATDGLFMNSSVEEACTGSLSCDGDGGDICGEPSNRKFRRKKAQKFAYNKWYMYGGGTFKKLYNAEKSGDNSVIKGRKSSPNQEHEFAQGLQKRLSLVQKETVTTATSTMNLTHSSAAVGPPGCPPANLSLVSALDFNLQTSQFNSLCSSLKAPLRRNLSLSVLPLPTIGSLVSHKTDCVNRTEAGRLIYEEKHTDSSSQLCRAHIPSDRKKQRTDDKIICPVEMETGPNTLTHPPPSVTGSVPQQDTNLTYINLQKDPKHTQLKGALFPQCIINANTPSVSTSSLISTPPSAKSSFLPKYQLKLPNAAEPDSNPPPRVVDKPTESEGHAFTSPHTKQTSPSITTCEKDCREAISSLPTQTCDIKKTNSFSSTGQQLVTTLCQTETSRLLQNPASSLAVVHRQFAATTITTSCLQDYHTGLCSTLIQPSKSAADSMPMQLPETVAPAAVNFPAKLNATTAHSQTPAAAVTALSQDQPYLSPNPPLPHAHLPAPSHLSSPGNPAQLGPNTPVVPCHVVPFDQVPPAAQNVFHVHTADLQICFQIISDEQLALIEPQIERPSGSGFSQRPPEGVLDKSQRLESCNERRDPEQPRHQKEKSESLATLNTERQTPPLSVQFGPAEPGLHLAKHSNSTQAETSAESVPPETLGPSLHPHKYGHVNTITETQSSAGDVMSTAASFGAIKSGRGQTPEEEQALSLNQCAEEHRRVSQGGVVSQTLSGQHKLSMSSLSPGTVNQSSMTSEVLGKESQHKLKDQEASHNVTTMKTKGACKNNGLQSGERLGQAPAVKLSGSVSSLSINMCKDPKQMETQASIYCSNQVEPAFCETLTSSKRDKTGSDRDGPSEDSAPLVETTPCESQDMISSASVNIQVERPKHIPAVCTSVQAAGLMEGASQAGCAAQKKPQTRGHPGTPGEPNSTHWKPKQSQEDGQTNQQYLEEQGGGGVTGGDKTRGIRTDKVPEQWAASNCSYTALSDMTKPEADSTKVRADSWISEQHLQHLSQVHSGMSECPPHTPQQAPGASHNLNLPASSIQTRLFNSPQPPLEMGHFYLSQQNWESSGILNPQAQVLSESNSSRHIKAQLHLSDTQNVFLRTEPGPHQTQTFSHQDQKQTSTAPSIQQGNTTAGNSSPAASCCNKLTSGRLKNPAAGTSSPTHSGPASQVCRAPAGLTGDIQMSKNSYNASNLFTHIEPNEKHDTINKAQNDYMSQSSNIERHDITNKYQSIFFSGPLHGYQAAESLTSGLRPVQSCQDYTDDTSSSDDEGKLIIEL